MTHDLGRALVLMGILIVLVGLVLMFADRVPWLGRLPGDIVIRRKGFTLYLPIVTSIVLSLLLTAVMWLVRRR